MSNLCFPLSPPLQDENTCHSDHQQDPISLAVEMAAVNHSVLALAGQGGSEIKTEAIDDD